MSTAKFLDVPFIQEVVACKRSVERYIPQTNVVIELGGEDANHLFWKICRTTYEWNMCRWNARKSSSGTMRQPNSVPQTQFQTKRPSSPRTASQVPSQAGSSAARKPAPFRPAKKAAAESHPASREVRGCGEAPGDQHQQRQGDHQPREIPPESKVEHHPAANPAAIPVRQL